LNALRLTRAATSLALVAALGGLADAHRGSIVYIDASVSGRHVAADVKIADADLGPALAWTDDRRPTREHTIAAQKAIAAYVLSRITVTGTDDNAPIACPGTANRLGFEDRADGFFAVVKLQWSCPRATARLTLRDELFFDLDTRHQAFARVGDTVVVLHGASRDLPLGERRVSLVEQLTDYVRLGIAHIFTGYDHLAFLLGLLVALPLAAGIPLRGILGIVTAFTVAHSVTLICAGLGLLRLPERVVEPAIALSIVAVAVENLLRKPRGRIWLAFGFGLIHGFGFASSLVEVGLPPRGVVPSLIAFNVGVELGQLAVVALAAPLLYVAVRATHRERAIRIALSSLLGAFGLFWLVTRVLELRL
jgi:hypothetical protein